MKTRFSFVIIATLFALPALAAASDALVDTKDFTPAVYDYLYKNYENLRANQIAAAAQAPAANRNPLLHLTTMLNYDIGERPGITAATDRHGQTVIDLRKLPFSSEVFDSGMRPWSSWWFPKVAKEFTQINGMSSAILDKFDRFFSLSGTSESALAFERNLEKNMGSVSWEGLCDAWAIASILHKEPKFPVAADVGADGSSITFSVSDLKGLLLKTYEAVDQNEFEIYGEKFLGNKHSWIQPDLFPDQFHRLVEYYLGEKKQPFIMDHDPGIEVWNVPVFKANFKMERVANDPKSVAVRMWLFTAAPAETNQKNAVGTKELIKEYNYILTGDLSFDKSKLYVKSGRWTKSTIVDSEANHPDYVIVPKGRSVTRKTYNKMLDIKKVDLLMTNTYE